MNDDILTRKEVAKLLKLTPRSIVNLENAGKLTSFKLNGAVRFRRSDIDKTIEEQIAASIKPKEHAVA